MKPSKKTTVASKDKTLAAMPKDRRGNTEKKQKNAGKEYVQDGTEEKVHEKQ